MERAPICQLCHREIQAKDEIVFPTFVESGEASQYMTHERCFDRFRVGQESRAN